MRQFSIIPDNDYSPVDQYVDYLKYDIYNNLRMSSLSESFNDPLFLQQLAVVQSGEMNRAIKTNGMLFCEGMRYTNDNIREASSSLSKKIDTASSHIASSLDNGFTMLNRSMLGIGDEIAKTNSELHSFHETVDKGIGAICNNQRATNMQLGNIANNQRVTNIQLGGIADSLHVMKRLFGTLFSVLETQLTTTIALLNDLLDEIRIPETQRERRYHIEQGTKFLSMGIKYDSIFYCEDAIDEFEKALQIDRKDFYSWYYLGFMYLRVPELVDLDKAKEALERFVHYARAEYERVKGGSLLGRIDEAYMMLAEIQYLKMDSADAIQYLAKCSNMYAEKVSFAKAKYLSATKEASNMSEASEILKSLIEKNPYLSLQVLEDADLMNNSAVFNMLIAIADSTNANATNIVSELLEKCVLYKEDNSQYLERIEHAKELAAKNSYLDAIEAIKLLKIKQKWELKQAKELVDKIKDEDEDEIEYLDLEQKWKELVKSINTRFESDCLDYFKVKQEEQSKCERIERKWRQMLAVGRAKAAAALAEREKREAAARAEREAAERKEQRKEIFKWIFGIAIVGGIITAIIIWWKWILAVIIVIGLLLFLFSES